MVPLHRILAATDFSPAGHLAVARAGQLAQLYGAELTLLHATPDWRLFSQHAAAKQQYYDCITRTADELLSEEVKWLRSHYGLRTVRGEVQRDSATQAICRMAESLTPDLLVMGAAGEQVLLNGSAFMGGTALKILARTGVPLLLVRTPEAGPYQSVLAAVPADLSEADRVVHCALALAGAGTLHLVRAYDAPYVQRMHLSALAEAAIAEAVAGQLQTATQDCELLRRAAPPDQRVQTHLVLGAPVEAVLTQVQSLAPQLVVVGQHRHYPGRHPGEWAAGIGTRIAYHCTADVLVVP